MTDANARPVSMRKKKPAQPATDAARPNLARVLAGLLVLSGLAAVFSALTFYGEHDFLVKNLQKQQPSQKITTATIAGVSSQTSAGLTTALSADVGSTLSATAITTATDKTVAVFRASLPSVNVTKDQLNDQAKNVRSTVTDALKSVTGSLTAAKVSTQASTVQKKVSDDLTTLRKGQLTRSQIEDQADKIPTSQLVLSLFLLLSLSFVAKGVYDGKFWGRWAVPAVWVLASFTSTPAGFTAILLLGSELPLPYKSLSALAAAALTAAVVMTFLRPTRAWFEAHRPAVAPGARQRRGLFAPRVAPSSGGSSTGRRPVAEPVIEPVAVPKPSGADRARTKKRVAAESARTGAEAARTRAKTASKSRRTES